MIADHLTGIELFGAELWKVADNLRANSNLASNEYFMPILGLILLGDLRIEPERSRRNIVGQGNMKRWALKRSPRTGQGNSSLTSSAQRRHIGPSYKAE